MVAETVPSNTIRAYKFLVPWTMFVIAILWTFFVLAMAFVPPEGTLISSDYNFFYCTHAIVTIGLVGLSFGYFLIWAHVLPNYGKYVNKIENFQLDTGELGHTIVKVPHLADLETWEAAHQDNNDVEELAYAQEDSDNAEKFLNVISQHKL